MNLTYLTWWLRHEIVAQTYRVGRRLMSVHAPGDPICRRAQTAAVAHRRGHGIECAPCARQRRAGALWDRLLQEDQ